MTSITEPFELDGVTISTTEVSILSGTETLQTNTTAGLYQVFVDGVANMTKTEEYKIRIYEKVEGTGGTKRVLFQSTLKGVQSENWVSPLLMLKNGWDVTLAKVAGTGVAFDASIRKMDPAVAGDQMALSDGAITTAKFAAGAIDAAAIANGAIDAATFATGAIDAAALAADAGTEIATAVWASATRILTAIDEDSTTLDLDATIRAAIGMSSANLDTQLDALPTAAENADAVWDEDATAHQTQGTFGQAIGDPVADTGTIFKATVTDATGVTVGTDTATLLTRLGTPSDLGSGATVAANLADIEAQTDDIGAAGAGLTAVPVISGAMTESYAADGAAVTLVQALYQILGMLQEKSITGTTLTVNKLDGTTAAMTFTLDDAINPTSITRAS